MWLIETRTLKLKFVTDAYEEDLPYAILSHTWVSGEEVTFQEFQDLEEAQRTKPSGYAKIKKTCELALREKTPLEYCWVDTCCIDKTSSAELTEAINSMFRWYKKSAVCYAFLSDLEPGKSTKQEDLAPCRWFTRGWTLQELVAPHTLAFFDKEWKFRGTKRKLRSTLSRITGISVEVLSDPEDVFQICIAKRMSWAASRETTRIEDKAYCLLGIFGVYMPMIYGEGSKAFMRLQEELIKDNHDRSIFAWRALRKDSKQEYRGLLAHDPSEFAHCARFGTLQMAYRSQSEFGLTNRGVRFEGRLSLSRQDDFKYLLDLECCDYVDDKMSWVSIILEKTGRNGYVRSEPHNLRYFDRFVDHKYYPPYLSISQFFVAKDLRQRESRSVESQYALSVQVNLPKQARIMSVGPEELWDASQDLFWTLGADTFIAYVWFYISMPGQNVECLLVCGTRRPSYTDMVKPTQSKSGTVNDENRNHKGEKVIGPANIRKRIPWCYLSTNKAQWIRLMSNDNSTRSTFDSNNFLSRMWDVVPDPKPTTHKTSYDGMSILNIEASVSLHKLRKQDAFLVDVTAWGDGLKRTEAQDLPAITGLGEPHDSLGLKMDGPSARHRLMLPFRHGSGRSNSHSRSPSGEDRKRASKHEQGEEHDTRM